MQFTQNHGSWKTCDSRDIWELYSGIRQQLWLCAFTPSAYDLNRPLARKYIRQCICSHFSQNNREYECSICLMLVYAQIMPFTSCLWAMLKVLSLPLVTVLKMCELAIVRVKWKKFTVAILMQCGESTLWQPRIFNKLPPSQQLSWIVPDKIAPPHGSSHCGTWLTFVPRRLPRCIVPQVWRADSESTSSLWAVTPYMQISCYVLSKGAFTASQWDLGHILSRVKEVDCNIKKEWPHCSGWTSCY